MPRRLAVALVALLVPLVGSPVAAGAAGPVDVPVRAAALPDDPLWRYQWGPPLVRAPEVWEQPTARRPVVAVVDTGVDGSHPDLRRAVLPGIDLVDGGPGNVDPNGHGTEVAGVIAARGRNGVGVAGYCWRCSILPVRALDAGGGGSSSTVAAGIDWAVEQGASVVNLSLVADQPTDLVTAAVARARARGVVVVAAAGNDGSGAARYPAASEGVLGVVATTTADRPYPWASRGAWADLGAPGCAVTAVGRSYGEVCGSSMASPAVAGIIGLALSVVPGATALEVEEALLVTARRMVRTAAAAGRVDAAAAVEHLARTAG